MTNSIDRFRNKTQLNPLTGCWEWCAGTDYKGYGNFSVKGRTQKAHRFSYEYFVGPLTDEITLDHRTCQNEACVNPGHLDPCSREENTRRAWSLRKGFVG